MCKELQQNSVCMSVDSRWFVRAEFGEWCDVGTTVMVCQTAHGLLLMCVCVCVCVPLLYFQLLIVFLSDTDGTLFYTFRKFRFN